MEARGTLGVRIRIAKIGLDSAWNGISRGHGLNTDWPKIRSVRRSGLDVVMNRSRSRSVRGLAAATDRTRTVQGFGLCAGGVDVIAEKLRPRLVHGLDT